MENQNKNILLKGLERIAIENNVSLKYDKHSDKTYTGYSLKIKGRYFFQIGLSTVFDDFGGEFTLENLVESRNVFSMDRKKLEDVFNTFIKELRKPVGPYNGEMELDYSLGFDSGGSAEREYIRLHMHPDRISAGNYILFYFDDTHLRGMDSDPYSGYDGYIGGFISDGENGGFASCSLRLSTVCPDYRGPLDDTHTIGDMSLLAGDYKIPKITKEQFIEEIAKIIKLARQ